MDGFHVAVMNTLFRTLEESRTLRRREKGESEEGSTSSLLIHPLRPKPGSHSMGPPGMTTPHRETPPTPGRNFQILNLDSPNSARVRMVESFYEYFFFFIFFIYSFCQSYYFYEEKTFFLAIFLCIIN